MGYLLTPGYLPNAGFFSFILLNTFFIYSSCLFRDSIFISLLFFSSSCSFFCSCISLSLCRSLLCPSLLCVSVSLCLCVFVSLCLCVYVSVFVSVSVSLC